MGCQKSIFVILLIYLNLQANLGVSCLELDPDGGYHIVIGVSDNEEEDPLEYVTAIKEMVDELTAILWSSTNLTFYIKSVQIVVPDKWGTHSQLGAVVSTKATYDQADILITNETEVPYTENYHQCGRPGLRIQLPFAVRDSVRMEGLYGSRAKGLLNLWLRYRFGVWEEHGYPDHVATPYMYNENDIDHSPWILTSCNYNDLQGKYGSIYDDDDGPDCYTNGSIPMSPDCVYKPYHDAQGVPSSLMNFQWVESINKFCDERTHDKRAPNRQNLYCDHKSVWEIIRESADYKMLNPIDEETLPGPVPAIKYSIVFKSPKLHLYILLDLSAPNISPPQKVYHTWVQELRNFVKNLPSDVVTTLVAYPNLNGSATNLRSLVDWTLLDSPAKDQIKTELDFIQIEKPMILDFQRPLLEAVAELRARNHPNGAILLVLRTNDLVPMIGVPWTGPGTYEEDILLHLKQFGIMLCAIAINLSEDERPTFQYLATESKGKSVLIRKEDEDNQANKMDYVLELITRQLSRETPLPREVDYEIIYREYLKDFDRKSILIPKRNDIDWLHIHVTVHEVDKLDYIRFGLPDPDEPEHFTSRIEWNYNKTNIFASQIYSKQVSVSGMVDHDGTWAWELYVATRRFGLLAMVLVYGSKTRASPRSVDAPLLGNRIKAEISTSVVGLSNVYKDCNGSEIHSEPLAIYVKLRDENNQPILFKNPHHSEPTKSIFYASILHSGTGNVYTTVLDDNGRDADLLASDGVYSGYIYPNDDGGYQVYVTLYDAKSGKAVPVHENVNPIGRIHSIRQDDLRVQVNGTALNTPYSIVFDMPSLVWTTDWCFGKRYISRVLDTHVGVTENDTQIVKVTFTVPIITSSPLGHYFDDNEYAIYYMGMGRFAKDVDTLIDDVDKGDLTVFLIEMEPPGRQVSVYLPRNGSLAFAFHLLDYRQSPTKSFASNIARIQGWRPDKTEEPTTKPPVTGCNTECMLAIGGGCGLIIAVLTLISFVLWRRNRAQHAKLTLLSRDEIKEFLHGHPTVHKNKVSHTSKKGPPSQEPVGVGDNEYLLCERIQSLPYDSKYEIPNNKLHIDKTELLGSGTFGNVYKGYVVNMPGTSGKVLVVAVKTMKQCMDKSYFKALLTEVKLMTHIGNTHPNIVKLVGACTKNIRKCEVFLATEFCVNGSLYSYLLKLDASNFRNLIDTYGKIAFLDRLDELNNNNNRKTEIATTWTLIKWAREIANGMTFLGQKKIVHGDIAARNILLDSSLVAKISDFGLSKQMVHNYGNYSNYNEQTEVEVESGGLLPWKWLAPEALTYMKFSVASDVWAYGVTIWEIFTLGQVPYPGVKWSPDFVNQLEKGGLRLQKPNYATDAIYEIMADCWKLEPKMRITFNEIKTDFDKMLVISSPGEYLTLQ